MISGSKIILRPKTLDDAPDEYIWQTDPELARLDAAPVFPISYHEFLTGFSQELRSSGKKEHFAIDTLEGKHIGSCSLYNMDEAKGETELGIMIGDRSYWNQGYGTDAIKALVKYAFSKNGFNRIYLKTLDWNVRAQNCFKKCGFVIFGGRERIGFKFVLMEVLRRDWTEGSEL